MSGAEIGERSARLEREARALQGCEDEIIEFVGTVQPFGALIATDPDVRTITHASANTADLLGLDAASLLGQPVESILGSELSHRLRNAAGMQTISISREYVGRWTLGSTPVDVMVHGVAEALVVEVQKVTDELDTAHTFGLVRQTMALIDVEAPVEQVLSDAVRPLRSLAGFDRVMAYRFGADGSGEVVAESCRAGVDSFLGLRFPAFDIPQSARRLYATTPIRTICDVTAEQSPILTHADPTSTPTPLDLSLAVSRGTVEVHSEYLKNMGVRATLTLPIVVDGDLWGLFAFHHREPRWLTTGLLMACEVTGRTLSSGVQQQVHRDRWETTERCVDLVAALIVEDDGSAGIGLRWDVLGPQLRDVLPCDGVVVFLAGQIYRIGSCPSDAAIEAISDDVRSVENVTAIDDLPARFPALELGAVAGVLKIQPRGAALSLMFFRDLAKHSVRWAGAPDKDVIETSGELRLSPRGSFDAFLEQVGDRCLSWEHRDVLVAESIHSAMESSLRIRDAAKAHNQRMGLVVRELNHRVRNMLGLVQSLAMQTRRSSEDLDDYGTSLDERLGLLAAAHDLLTERQWDSIDFQTLIRRTAEPHMRRHGESVELSGPLTAVDPSIASLLSLVVHELFSNAARHGALSVPAGSVRVAWDFDGEWLSLDWSERGGPKVEAPTRSGFGSVIINEAIPFELEGVSKIEFAPHGVAVNIRIPRPLVEPRLEPQVAEASEASSDTAPHLPSPMLVVEDDFLISRETVRLMGEFGDGDVQVAATPQQALEAIERFEPKLVTLDIDLRGQSSLPVADRLAELGIPFLFITGYGIEVELGEHVAPVLVKPVKADRLLAALRKLVLDGGRGEGDE